jgi:manganese transport protein
MTTLTERTLAAGHEALAGRHRGIRAFLPFLGPAVIASVAYMDPGNFATNIEAGAKYGYTLLWVVVAANIVAMLFQALSAKLGIVTGMSLATNCRERFPAPVVYAMWIVSEIAAMATDLAEFLGAALALSLLLHLPLLASLTIVAIATYAMLTLQGSGFRPMEILIGIFVAIIGVSYLIELVIAPPDWTLFGYHALVPRLAGQHSVMLAVGIVGATVMPHAIYLHSSLTHDRVPASTPPERRRMLRFSNAEVLLALGLAGLINMAMVAMAATVFHDASHDTVADIETA